MGGGANFCNGYLVDRLLSSEISIPVSVSLFLSVSMSLWLSLSFFIFAWLYFSVSPSRVDPVAGTDIRHLAEGCTDRAPNSLNSSPLGPSERRLAPPRIPLAGSSVVAKLTSLFYLQRILLGASARMVVRISATATWSTRSWILKYRCRCRYHFRNDYFLLSVSFCLIIFAVLFIVIGVAVHRCG